MDIKKLVNDVLQVPGTIRGTRAIAAYMGVSPTTISRWRRRFRGRTEVHLCFPAMEMPTGKGWNFAVMTHVGLILTWLARWCEIDGEALRNRPKRIRHAKVAQLGETGEKASPAGEKPLSLHERLARLSEPERAWVIRNELTPAQLEELGLPPRSVQVEPIIGQPVEKVCTCGYAGSPCMAHD